MRMNTILQVCIGALPLLIAVAVYMIAKRKLLLPSILLGIDIICCVAVAILCPVKNVVPIGDVEALDVYETYKAMKDGQLNEASELLNKTFLSAGDKTEVTLAKARLYAMQGSWEESVALYEKVMSVDKSLLKPDETKLVKDMIAGDILSASELSYQASNIAYLTSQGLNPEQYGFMKLSEAQIASNIARLDEFQHKAISRVVANELFALEEKYPIVKEIDKVDKLVNQIMSYSYNNYKGVAYDDGNGNYMQGDALNIDEAGLQKIKALNSRLERYKETYPELFTENKYAEAYVFSEAIAKDDLDKIWEKGNTVECEIIANMYTSGIITEENFSPKFTKEYKAIHKEVVDQCKKIATDINGIEDINEIYIKGDSVKDIVTKLNKVDNFALHQMSKDMEQNVGKGVVEADKLSHYYISMSAVAGVMGNDTAAKDYFNESVVHSDKSSDKELAAVLGTIQNSYEEGDDLDYIEIAKDVAKSYQDSYHYDIVSNEVTAKVEGTVGAAVSETKATISIGKVDVSKFDKLSVSVQYSGDVELKKKIVKLTDCNIDIKDFTITKRQYEGSKVILLCDVSGSMDGSIDLLKEAVITYIRSMDENEQVNIVLFSDKIDMESGFSKDKDALVQFAESQIYTRGGTLIGTSTNVCLDQFKDGNVANTLIVMTDGEDNRPWSDNDIKNTIGGKAKENNTYIYTIGVGSSVTQKYLENIAAAGGGEFMYCSDISRLESTYTFIHERINNEYIITFEAEDLDSLNRTLEIVVDDGKMKTPAKDVADYYLKGEDVEEDKDVIFSTELPKGITVKGLSVNQIEKSTEKQQVKILGTGFKDAKITNVYLESTKGTSNCKIKEVKDDSITFQIAPSVAEGTYSVFVTIDGKKYKVDRLVIGTPDTSEVIFGAYHFKADNIEIKDNQTILTGNVILNGYLYFDGQVTLSGNVNKDSSVTLSTNSPAYVHHDAENYSGLEKVLFLNSKKTKAFDNITVKIFDDGANYNNYSNYKAEMSQGSKYGILELGVVSLEGCVTYIYPDRVELVSSMGLLKDNPITEVLTNGVEFFQIDDMPTLKYDAKSKAMLMKEGPFTYFEMDIELKAGEDVEVSVADFITLDGEAKFHLMYDTYNGQFSLGLVLSTGKEGDTPQKLGDKSEVLQSGDAGITISITGERKGNKYFSASVALPLELTFTVYGVPVTVTDLTASLENYNITQAVNDIKTGNALKSKLQKYLGNQEGADLKVSGAVELVSTSALPDKVQKFVKKYLGDDVSLISADDIYGSVGIDYPHIAAGATVNVLGCVKVAQIDMELGVISYPDYVSELINNKSNKKHYGFTFSSFKGIQFDWDAVGAEVGGKISATVTVDDFLVSGYVCGSVSANTEINIFGTKFDVDGVAKTEAYAAIWHTGKKWKAAAMVVASVDGHANIDIFGVNIIEKEIHEKCVVVDEEL